MHTLTTGENARQRNRRSVKNLGVGLAGLDGVNQKVPLSAAAKRDLQNAFKTFQVIRLNTNGVMLEGTLIKTGSAKSWGEKLDKLSEIVRSNDPAYFIVFRTAKDVLIVTFVPDEAKPFQKMVYASSKESVKDAILDLDPAIELEEFNVADSKEMTFKYYTRKTIAPKPYTEAELQRQEEDAAPKGGNYGALARIIAMQKGEAVGNRDVLSGSATAKPMALPGMAAGGMVNMGNLRAGLKPIGKIKVKKGVVPIPAKDITAPQKKELFVPKVSPEEQEYKEMLQEFGVNDTEQRARVEFDIIMSFTAKSVSGKSNKLRKSSRGSDILAPSKQSTSQILTGNASSNRSNRSKEVVARKKSSYLRGNPSNVQMSRSNKVAAQPNSESQQQQQQQQIPAVNMPRKPKKKGNFFSRFFGRKKA